MEKKDLKSYSNNCHLMAGLDVIGDRVDQEKIREAWLRNGWVPGKGMHRHNYQNAMKELGIELRPMRSKEWRGNWQDPRPTVARIQAKYPKGVYLVGIRGHVFVMRDGRIVDPNIGGQTRAEVWDMCEVLNAAMPKVGNRLKFRVARPGRSAASDREWTAYMYTLEVKRETGMWPLLSDVIRDTAFTQADFNYRFKRGRVLLVDETA